MNFLKIQNDGEIQEEALTLLGASTKRNDASKIGHFGSGFKYALAYLLRSEIEVRVYAGIKRIKIGTSPVKLRDQNYDVITVNGKETSITTDLGADWLTWYAIREIYSNAIDEGNAKISVVKTPAVAKGKTAVFIKVTKDVHHFIENQALYFATKRKPIYQHKGFKVYQKTQNKAIIYRKGIRVAETDALYDYDFETLSINESRTPEHSWTVPEALWKNLMITTDVKIIKEVLENTEGRGLEGSASQTFIDVKGTPSPAWEKAIGQKWIIGTKQKGLATDEQKANAVFLPEKLYDKVNVAFDTLATIGSETDEPYITIEQNETQSQMLDAAKNTLLELEIEIGYQIEVARFSNKRILGYADLKRETIIVSEATLDLGTREICATIIEENLHIKTQEFDETRGFQNAIINEFISYALKTKNRIL